MDINIFILTDKETKKAVKEILDNLKNHPEVLQQMIKKFKK